MLKGDMICKYIKDPVTRHRVGVVVATLFYDAYLKSKPVVVVSWSKCHTSLDKYDPKICMKIAQNRAKYYYDFLVTNIVEHTSVTMNINNRPRLHTELISAVDYIVARAKKFYKQATEVIVIPYRTAYEDINKQDMLNREFENMTGVPRD